MIHRREVWEIVEGERDRISSGNLEEPEAMACSSTTVHNLGRHFRCILVEAVRWTGPCGRSRPRSSVRRWFSDERLREWIDEHRPGFEFLGEPGAHPSKPGGPVWRLARIVHQANLTEFSYWFRSHSRYLTPMHLLGKRTLGFINTGGKSICEQYARSFSWQCTETRRLKSSATMGEQLHEKPPDLSTWNPDQLIARVAFLEQQLKEQTLKCVSANAPLQTILIA